LTLHRETQACRQPWGLRLNLADARIHESPSSRVPMAHPRLDSSSDRNQYGVSLQVGFVLSVGLLLGIARLPLPTDGEAEPKVQTRETTHLRSLQPTRQTQSPPAPPKPPVPQVVPDEEVLEPPRADFDAALGLIAASSQKATSGSDASVSGAKGKIDCGGAGSLREKIRYPPSALDRGLEGRVLVEFVVGEGGEIKNPKVTDGASGVLNRAALRAVRRLECTPGRQQSRPVGMKVTLPAVFTLPKRMEAGR